MLVAADSASMEAAASCAGISTQNHPSSPDFLFTLIPPLSIMSRASSYLLIVSAVRATQAMNDTFVSGWVQEPDGRGTWSILWSCLVTIFLCTWSVLHLTVKVGDWKSRFLRRCRYTILVLVAPEWALMESIESHAIARQFLSHLRYHGGSEWTMVHAQFTCDHGFQTVCGDHGAKTCDLNELVRLVREGRISEPPISKDELLSRSKSDGLVKAIALLQITWFAAQILTRAIQRLHVTPLEILVVAFISCSMVTYAFCWSKPQNVEYPVIIKLLDIHKPINEVAQRTNPASIQSAQTVASIHSEASSANLGTTLNQSDKQESSRRTPASPEHLPKQSLLYKWLVDKHDSLYSMILLTFCTTLFGAIHCLVWASPFPSHVEAVLWRNCAVITTSTPIIFVSMMHHSLEGGYSSYALAVWVLSIISYVIARTIIIVLALIALRRLPADAYQTVSWSQYFPNYAA